MLGRIFPKQFDNAWRGHWLAIGFLIPVVLLKSMMGVNSVFNTRSVLTGPDAIPLDSYSAAGAQAVVSLFALSALGNLVLVTLSIVALVRYRAMIPFLYLLMLAEYAGRRALLFANPIGRSEGTPIGFYINMTLLALLLIGFALSLQNRDPLAKAK